ncbi:hypothetical protein VTK73DRAFT_8704 [Phialemonium thermophilum]|uniref:Cysteine proteinase 1, mitochondrial n=1 Tax=Phialemonium thermophilum TaxID=223376 RepID=A0ABR3W6T3_9PEZI
MGNSQSTASAQAGAREKELLEQLRALQVDRKRSTASEDGEWTSEKGPRICSVQRDRTPEEISVSEVEQWQETLLEDPKNRLALSVLSTTNPREALASRSAKIADQQVFNVKIPFEGGPITNQRSSGRCWLFASTNVFRVALMQKYRLDAFELSQAYLFFWDKLEKANWFLEQVIDTADQPLDGRLVQHLLQEPLSDGGQWDMVYNLVAKYGLVPQVLYPDSHNAKSSSVLNSIVFSKLREYALTLRKLSASRASSGSADGSPSAAAEALSREKAKMLKEIHTILTLTLGPPPAVDQEFEWEFVDRDGKARTVRTTPLAFSRDIYSSGAVSVTSSTVEGMLSLVHDPRNPPLRLLTVDRLGNVVGGRGIRYVNVAMPALKRACVAQLRAGLPVFFGCDVGKFSSSAAGAGIMDLRLVDYELGLGVSLLRLSKADRLRAGESSMTHAMVLTAVHIDQHTGSPVRWRVQNSWGPDAGDAGWFVMEDRWMDEFVYQAVIDPRFLPREIRDVAGSADPIVLPLWDPMGSLA